MKRAISNLQQLAYDTLFETISEGISLIVNNAVDLNESAYHLHQAGRFRTSEIMSGFAEEEAAKVLMLIDFVRCPRDFDGRGRLLKRFYSHVAKRIYAMTCEYPNIASFGELKGLVDQERRSWYLDGPNDVDWIFPNAISTEREQALYVDYVADVTDVDCSDFWAAPDESLNCPSEYPVPDCVRLAVALSEAGAGSTDGLAEIANAWRGCRPNPETDRGEVRGLIADTLDRLALNGDCVDQPTAQLILRRWTFPMWPLEVTEQRDRPAESIDDLREQRRARIAWIEDTEAKRDPPPAIARSRVEELSEAHAAWDRDADEALRQDWKQEGRFRFLPSAADTAKIFELPSYKILKHKFGGLNEEERIALVALGWFARDRLANWPAVHARAVKQAPTQNDGYQISLGGYWLPGLDRWEASPQPFVAGQWHNRSRPYDPVTGQPQSSTGCCSD